MRRFQLGLIFSLITLLVQLIAPVSATYAMANADPLSVVPICAHMGDTALAGGEALISDQGGTPSPARHDKSCPCCTLLCSVAHAAFPAPSDIPASIATPQRLPQRLVFIVASFIPAARPALPRAQPRAPPVFS